MAGEWVEKTIDDISDVIGGSTPSTRNPANFDGDIPWLTPKDLAGPHPRYVSHGKRNLSYEGLKNCSAQLLPKNSVLLSSRAPIGYIAIAANPIATNQGFRSLIVKPGYDHEFIYYWLSANVEELERHATGSTFKELPGSVLKQIRIRLPIDITEQQAIAHILGTLDDKIELNRRMNKTLEEMARAIFKSWFVDFDPVHAKAAVRREHPKWTDEQVSRAACPKLKPEISALFPDSFEDSELGPIPKGWRIETLANLCEKPQYGYTASASNEPIGPQFLRITDINKQAWIEWQNVPFCYINKKNHIKYALHKGDILIARIADPGHGTMIEENVNAVFASYLIRFRPKKPEFERFLQYWLRSENYWDLVRAQQSGTTRANLNAQILEGFSLITPESQVLKFFSSQVEGLRNKILANVRESNTYGTIRDKLLPKLIRGHIRLT